MESVMKSLVITESLDLYFTFHLEDTLAVVMEMSELLEAQHTYFFNIFSDTWHGMGTGEFH